MPFIRRMLMLAPIVVAAVLACCSSRSSQREAPPILAPRSTRELGQTSGASTEAGCPDAARSAALFDVIGSTSVGKTIPADLTEALSALERVLTQDQRRALFCAGATPPVPLRAPLALWIRNSWGLYGGSPLAVDMIARGFIHPDDMSNAIVTSFARRLRGEPLQLEAQVERYRRFWKSQGVDAVAEQRRLSQ